MAQMPSADRSLQAILYQIVRGIVLAHQRERVAPQRRNMLFDQNRGLVHDRTFMIATGRGALGPGRSGTNS